VSSLTPRAVWFVGLRHACRRCSSSDRDTGAAPVQRRTGSRGLETFQPTRRSTSTVRTPLLGFIDRPFADTTVTASTPAWAVAQTSVRDCHVPNLFRSCRSSRLQRFSTQRVDPKTHSFDCPRVCCTPQPAMGFTTFRTPWRGLSTVPPARRPWTSRSIQKSSPVANTLRSVLLLGSRTMSSPRLVLSDAIAFTDWCALSPFRAGPAAVSPRCAALLFDLRAFFRRGVRCDARDVAAARPLDAPLGFGSTRSRCCRACRAAQLCWTFRLAARTALASPDPNVEGRQGCFGPVWLPRPVPRASPKGGPQRVAVAPAPPEGSTSAALHHGPRRTDGMPVDPPREEVPPRRSRHPKAQGFRRHRDASPKRLVRDPALAPKSGDRWFELVLPNPSAVARVRDGETARRGHTRPKACASARYSRAPRRMLRRTQGRDPEEPRRLGEPEAHPEVRPWRLVAPASPASWRAGSGQTDIVFTGTAETRSEDEVSPPIRRSG